MCGRFSLTTTSEAIAQNFGLSEIPLVEPRWNIAPTQAVATVVVSENRRQFQWMRWGLIPFWTKDKKIKSPLINARLETVTEKPSFRTAIKQRRCLILADGFYEWQKIGKHKQPYHFRLEAGQLFAFAGLWDCWRSPNAEEIISCTILTTVANEQVRSIHHRMPVIVPPDLYDLWLDPTFTNSQQVTSILSANPVWQVKLSDL